MDNGDYNMGMMHGLYGEECPCSNPSNVYPCHAQTPPMQSIGATAQCRSYPTTPETETLKISGRVRSGG